MMRTATMTTLLTLLATLFLLCSGQNNADKHDPTAAPDTRLTCEDGVTIHRSWFSVDVTLLEPAVVQHDGLVDYLNSDRENRLNMLRRNISREGYRDTSMTMVMVDRVTDERLGCLRDATTDVQKFAKARGPVASPGMIKNDMMIPLLQGAALVPTLLQKQWLEFDTAAFKKTPGYYVHVIVMFGEGYLSTDECAQSQWRGDGTDGCMTVPKQTEVKHYFDKRLTHFAFVTPNRTAVDAWKTVFNKDGVLYAPGLGYENDKIIRFVLDQIAKAVCVSSTDFPLPPGPAGDRKVLKTVVPCPSASPEPLPSKPSASPEPLPSKPSASPKPLPSKSSASPKPPRSKLTTTPEPLPSKLPRPEDIWLANEILKASATSHPTLRFIVLAGMIVALGVSIVS